MAKIITAEEIEQAKQQAEQKGVHQNWEECSFRKSTKGNIVCSSEGQDIFLFHPGAKIIHMMNELSPAATGALGKLTKKQRKRLKAQQLEEERNRIETAVKQQVENLRGTIEVPANSWAKEVELSAYAVAEGEQAVAMLAVTPIIVNKHNKKICNYKNPILFPLQDWSTDALKQKITSVYNGEHVEGDVLVAPNEKTNILQAIKCYMKEMKAAKVHPSIEPYIAKNGFYQLLDRVLDKDMQDKIVFNVTKFSICKDKCIHFSFYETPFVYNFKEETIHIQRLKPWQDTALFVKKHKTALLKCIAAAKELNCAATIEKQELQISAPFRDGVTRNLVLSDEQDTPMTAAAVKRWHKAAAAEAEVKLLEQEQEAIQKVERLPVYGNLLAFHVLEFIERNENYITETAAVKNLRGLNQSFSGTITDTEGSGRYGLLTDAEVTDVINSLVTCGLLWRRRYDGTYGVFYTLKTGKDCITFLSDMAHPTWKLKKHPFSEFSDLEWVRYLEKVRVDGKERKLTKKELQEQMQLLEHKNVILMHPEEVRAFLEQKPEEWYLYADTMYAVENGIQKKYWKQVKSLFPAQK